MTDAKWCFNGEYREKKANKGAYVIRSIMKKYGIEGDTIVSMAEFQ